MISTKLATAIRVHKWRFRFAFLPVRRVELVDGRVSEKGYYFWRVVFEIECGVIPTWTAYAHFNDGLMTGD